MTTNGGGSPDVHTDIILSFQQSLANITQFDTALAGLDARFGSLESKIVAMRTSLLGFSQQAAGLGRNVHSGGGNLANTVNGQVGNILLGANGQQLGVNKQTASTLFNTVNTQINRLVSGMANNIQTQLNPSLMAGKKIPLPAHEFQKLNDQIAKLINTHVGHVVRAIRTHGADLIKPADLKAAELSLGQATVQTIMNKIKEQLVKKLINPKLDAAGVKLTITQRDLQGMVNKIKKKLTESFEMNVGKFDLGAGTQAQLQGKMVQAKQNIDRAFSSYMQNMVSGVTQMNMQTSVPVSTMEKRLQKALATQLGVTTQQLQQQLQTISLGDAAALRLREDFKKLGSAINRKVNSGLGQEVNQMIDAINKTQVSYHPRLQSYMTNQINRMNNAIVKKIREQIDIQFQSMLNEINSVHVSPKNLNRNRRLNQLSTVDGDSYLGQVKQNTANRMNTARDPYAQRDAHFNNFGLGGALTNTVRHIVAGSLIGAPIAIMMQGWDTIKSNMEERLKIVNNLSMKDENMTENGKIDMTKANAAAGSVERTVRQYSTGYGLNYEDMYKVGTIATRRLETPEEIDKFVDLSGQIRLIDGEADLSTTIAPGLEAVSAQFQKSVFQMDEFVKALAVATNETKASTDEIIKALQRSGAMFHQSGETMTNSVAMVAASLQNTGLSGENVGNFYKSLLDRFNIKDVQNTFDDYAIPWENKETDKYGGVYSEMLTPSEIMNNIAKAMETMSSTESGTFLRKVAGTYQKSKTGATLPSFLDELYAGSDDANAAKGSDIIVQFAKLQAKMQAFDDTQLQQMIMNAARSPQASFTRVKDESSYLMEDVFKGLTPTIMETNQSLTNLLRMLDKNADGIASMIQVLGNILIGLGALKGSQYLWRQSGASAAMAVERNRAGFNNNIDRTLLGQDLDNRLYGDKRQGSRYMTQVLRNDALAPHMQAYAGMDTTKRTDFHNYMKQNNLQANSLKDLFGHMDDFNRVGSPLNATDLKNRLTPNMSTIMNHPQYQGLFNDRMRNSLNNDPMKFANSKIGANAAQSIAKMDKAGLDGLLGHLREVEVRTGAPIQNFKQLSTEVGNYSQNIRQSTTDMRNASPQFMNMDSQLTRIESRFNRAGNSAKSFRDVIKSIPTALKGIGSAAATAAMSIAGMGAQMMAMMLVGEVVATNARRSTNTDFQNKLEDATKEEENIQKMLNRAVSRENADGGFKSLGTLGKNITGGTLMDVLGDAYGGVADFFTGTDSHMNDDDRRDYNERIGDAIKELAKDKGMSDDDANRYARNVGDADWSGYGLEKFLKDSGFTMNDVKSKILTTKQDGEDKTPQERIDAAKESAYQEEFQRTKSEEEARAKAEEAAQAEYDKIASELMPGTFELPDFAGVKTAITDRIQQAKDQSEIRQVAQVLDGMKMNSKEYLNMRAEESDKLMKIYDEELKNMEERVTSMKGIVGEWYDQNEHLLLRGVDVEKPSEVTAAEQAISDNEKQKDEIQAERDKQELADKQEQYNGRVAIVDNGVSAADSRNTQRNLSSALNMDRTSTDYVDAQIESQKTLIQDLKSQLEELKKLKSEDVSGEHGQKVLDMENRISSEQEGLKNLGQDRYSAFTDEIERNVSKSSIEGEIDLVKKYLAGFAKDSVEYIEMQREILQKNLAVMRAELERLKGLEGLDPEQEKQRDLDVLQKQLEIAQVEGSIKETDMSSLEAVIRDLQEDSDKLKSDQDIEYLGTRLRTGLDESSPILRRLRVKQANERVGETQKEIEILRTKLAGYSANPEGEEYKRVQEQIADLTKQSLETQLSILDEMKSQGGTFNMPDGVTAMTYYDYMNRTGTNSTYTVQRGDVNVQITLPNVKDGQSATELQRIGENIGKGLNNGWSGQPLTNMINANVPTTYNGGRL